MYSRLRDSMRCVWEDEVGSCRRSGMRLPHGVWFGETSRRHQTSSRLSTTTLRSICSIRIVRLCKCGRVLWLRICSGLTAICQNLGSGATWDRWKTGCQHMESKDTSGWTFEGHRTSQELLTLAMLWWMLLRLPVLDSAAMCFV